MLKQLERLKAQISWLKDQIECLKELSLECNCNFEETSLSFSEGFLTAVFADGSEHSVEIPSDILQDLQSVLTIGDFGIDQKIDLRGTSETYGEEYRTRLSPVNLVISNITKGSGATLSERQLYLYSEDDIKTIVLRQEDNESYFELTGSAENSKVKMDTTLLTAIYTLRFPDKAAGEYIFATLDDVTVTPTNLTYTPSASQGQVNSDTGTDAVIPVVDDTNAGLATPAIKSAIDNLSTTYQFISQKNQLNGYAGLDGSGKINPSQLPAIALTDVFLVNSQVAQLALTAEEGDVAIRTDLNKSYIHNNGTSGTMADWYELLTPTDLVSSIFGRTGVVTAQSGDYNTSQVTEVTNLYYTQARFDTAFGLKSTTNLTEGSNLYFTNARAISALSGLYQPLDTDLTAIAALATTSYGRDLLIQVNAAAVLSYIGAQAAGDYLLNGGNPASANIKVGTSSGAFDTEIVRAGATMVAFGSGGVVSILQNGSIRSATSVNNFNLDIGSTSNVPMIISNINSTRDTFQIQNQHTSSTGNILGLWSNIAGVTAVRAAFQKDGRLTIPNGTASTDAINLGQLNNTYLKRGSSTQSGTGAATSFNIAHGLGVTPTFFNAVPNNAATAGISYITADATNITVVYSVPPVSAVNNLTWKWLASL